jgi:hypothetical protein
MASFTMSTNGCSVRVRLGIRPLIPGILSVEATETSSGHFKPMSANAHHAEGHEAVGDIKCGRALALLKHGSRCRIGDLLAKVTGADEARFNRQPLGGQTDSIPSHRLDEILELCQRVTVFRDGRSVEELAGADLTRPAVVEAIVGGVVETPVTRTNAQSSSEPALSVRDLAHATKVKGVSFDLRKGEVLGLGGLVGAGRSELARLLFGVDRPQAGSMTPEGTPYAPRSPADAGVGLCLKSGGSKD